MRISFFTLFVLFLMAPVMAQRIVAGQHGALDYYFDVNPDTTMTGPYNHFGFLPAADYAIDINGDGVVDYDLHSIGGGGLGGGSSATTIIPQGNNQVAFGNKDSCYLSQAGRYDYLTLAKPFNYLDTIDRNKIWQASSATLSSSSWNMSWGGCGFAAFQGANDQYIGTRMFLNGDTLYGWIRVINVTDLGFTLKDYASNGGPEGIDSPDHKFNVNLYPVPTKDRLVVEIPFSSKYNLRLYNMSGQHVLSQASITGFKTELDLSAQIKGMYFLEITDVASQKIVRKKIMVE